ncbi:hypothetical protein [Deinococcus frigens]|uniref:hypothetical protein n=1 Tax=Deinococcus frigens TaxID=249403 RepID=UPI000A7E31BE|nr:hypothetical protein [Deinococcus frigens]
MSGRQDPRYTPSTTFETFAFPHPSPVQREAIEKAARQLENVRAHLLAQQDPSRKVNTGALKAGQEVTAKSLTLTGAYNLLADYRKSGTEGMAGIKSLAPAHDTLDAAVAAAYGWDWPLPEDEMLSKLLALNLLRAAVEDVHRKQEETEAARLRELEKTQRAEQHAADKVQKAEQRKSDAAALAAQKKAERATRLDEVNPAD